MICKTVVFLMLILVSISCKKNNKNNLNDLQVRTMQEISNEMRSQSDQDFVIDQDARAFTQEMQTTPAESRPNSNTTNTNRTDQSTAPFTGNQQGAFTAQLISLRDRNRVNEIKNTLDTAGYSTEIQETQVNGVTNYRLRLAGSFSREYAEYLAKKIQSEFNEITDYWVTRR